MKKEILVFFILFSVINFGCNNNQGTNESEKNVNSIQSSFGELDPASLETKLVTLGVFSMRVPKEWRYFTIDEITSLKTQYLEQSKQIYQQDSGSDDPSKTVDVKAFDISENNGSFVVVSFTVPQSVNLISLLKSQVKDKMDYGIQQGFIKKYLGLQSIDENSLSGFYTMTIGNRGNIQLSGGIEHKKKKNTMIQLTLLAPPKWSETKSYSILSKIIQTISLIKEIK